MSTKAMFAGVGLAGVAQLETMKATRAATK
jgi:hypothetical protein